VIAGWVALAGHGRRLASRSLASRRGALPAKPPAAWENRATAFAWRIHGAQTSWANNADVKASILLALQGGALYAIISALGSGGLLARPGGGPYPTANAIGILALLLAIVSATIAIFPRLGKERKDLEHHGQVIYFGDLRRWNANELSSHIAALTTSEELSALSKQLTEMSRRNWVKHRWVQISLILSLTGILAVSVSAMTAL
jgi:hypothetical protein